MAGRNIRVATTRHPNSNRIEAPVTVKAYFMCAFAAFGGIFLGYDSGYINGVMGMRYFIHRFTGLPYPAVDVKKAALDAFVIPAWRQSLIVSIFSAGTFFGALIAGDLAEFLGRRVTIVLGCGVFFVGVVLQIASAGYILLIMGRIVAGLGVGFVSTSIILYLSETAPRKVRGAIIAGYQFCITLGVLIANCVVYATQDIPSSSSYRIPITIEVAWALILAIGLFVLPESPRYFVRRGNLEKATKSLSILRGQPLDSDHVKEELAEIVSNNEHELRNVPQGGYISGWKDCFEGDLSKPSSNLRRTILGISLQMVQQLTGVNFIFYFGAPFFQILGTIPDPFFVSLVTTLVNVCSTPISFWTIEYFGRRSLLIGGALAMLMFEFIIAIIGTSEPTDPSLVRAEITFICMSIFFFASTWGPCAWVVIGEIFPLTIRSRGVALSTASYWFCNCIIAVITPYMVGPRGDNMGPKVFFIWGVLCTICFAYAYFLVPEAKGLSLEQVDRMLESTTPRLSARWIPKTTHAAEMVLQDGPTFRPHRAGDSKRLGSSVLEMKRGRREHLR